MTTYFIDISNHQADIDLTKLPQQALSAGLIGIKVTEGRGWKDAQTPQLVAKARALGLRVRFYHFVSQGNTPQQEAANYIMTVRPHLRPGDELCLDWEPWADGRPGTNPAPGDTVWAATWLQDVTNAFPEHRMVVYMQQSTANAYRWGAIAERFPLWLAHYPPGNATTQGFTYSGRRGTVDPQWRVLDSWQFTDGGQLPGYAKSLDLNEYYQTVTKEDQPMNMPAVPPLKEADPHQWWTDSNGKRWKACLCMAYTLPLIEAEMKKRGLIKRSIDIFQGGYNPGRVAASAGTHDMGGVIDVAQGITKEEREVWAMFGVMMFPRTRQYGWTTGDHGHGVWHGCPHQTASADRQVTSGMKGYDGLVSNIYRDFVAPERTWVQAYESARNAQRPVEAPAPAPAEPKATEPTWGPQLALNGVRAEVYETTVDVELGGGGWHLVYPELFPAQPDAVAYVASATIAAEGDTQLASRYVAFHGDEWYRYATTEHAGNDAGHTWACWAHRGGIPVHLDIYSTQATKARVTLSTIVLKGN